MATWVIGRKQIGQHYPEVVLNDFELSSSRVMS